MEMPYSNITLHYMHDIVTGEPGGTSSLPVMVRQVMNCSQSDVMIPSFAWWPSEITNARCVAQGAEVGLGRFEPGLDGFKPGLDGFGRVVFIGAQRRNSR